MPIVVVLMHAEEHHMLDYNYESQSPAAYIVMYSGCKGKSDLTRKEHTISMLHVQYAMVSRLIYNVVPN